MFHFSHNFLIPIKSKESYSSDEDSSDDNVEVDAQEPISQLGSDMQKGELRQNIDGSICSDRGCQCQYNANYFYVTDIGSCVACGHIQ